MALALAGTIASAVADPPPPPSAPHAPSIIDRQFYQPTGDKGQRPTGLGWNVLFLVFRLRTLSTSGDLDRVPQLVAELRKDRSQHVEAGIGKDGRLMEWAAAFEKPEPGHRQISHLYAIHPGSQYTPKSRPEMVAAARKSIDFRLANGGHPGWSSAWIIDLRARFHQAAEAWKNLLAKSTTPTLFDTHPSS
jgi:alpha-L-fucosidase 2